MYLYLIQHGESQPEEINPLRPLSEKGKRDVIKIASFMKRARVEAGEIWHSSKLRSKETAEIIATTLSLRIVEKEGLGPNDPPASWIEKLSCADENIIIAGHLPFLQRLAVLLITGSDRGEIISFKEGGVACLKRTEEHWSVAWMVIPEILEGII